jgi:hypothetical protein
METDLRLRKGAILQGFAGYGGTAAGTPADGGSERMGGRTTIGLLVLAAALAGCAAMDDKIGTGNFFIQPGKFQFLKCPDLAQRYLGTSAREKQIVALMDRAGHDTVGTLIGATTYGTDLKQVRAESELLQQTMREKGCTNTVPTTK